MKLLMLKGLPGSGKSTYAKKLADQGYTRVNKDDLRAMLHNGKWSKVNEKQVLAVRDLIIKNALSSGKSVVVDDTNFHPIHREELAKMASEWHATFETKSFTDIPLQVCIDRDLKRTNSVGKDVIMQIYNQYLKPEPESYDEDTRLPHAILCDIDGTLAHGIGVTRKPYEWGKVASDTLDIEIAEMLMIYQDAGFKIILMSGRDSVCAGLTKEWLENHNIPYNELHMRPYMDQRKDSIVKKELFETHIKGQYYIDLVLDDRDQVVEMWRSMGLKVLQVAEGDF